MEITTKLYDFTHRTDVKLSPDGLIGDPELRRAQQKAKPKNNGPKPPRTVVGQVIVGSANNHAD